MKASELIAELERLIKENGDLSIEYFTTDYNGWISADLVGIEEEDWREDGEKRFFGIR